MVYHPEACMTLKDAAELLETQEYPATADDIKTTHGDFELDLPNGTETLGDIIDRAGDDTFDDATAAQHALMGAVGGEAIGRRNYSDRDPTPMGVDGPTQVSF